MNKLIEKKKRSYGWDKNRAATYVHAHAPKLLSVGRPHLGITSVDLRKQCPPVYNQGDLGSCTGNAISAAVQFDDPNLGNPSRLFVYYNERAKEGTISDDVGAIIADGVQCIQTNGICTEVTWPYDTSKFNIKPSDAAYDEASHHKAIDAQPLHQTLQQLKQCLIDGFPFVFGFTVFDSFEGPDVAQTGILNVPIAGEQEVGGHAVLCVGFDDSTARFIVRNSWGADWGQNGYFTMPYEYMLNKDRANDFWVIKKIIDT